MEKLSEIVRSIGFYVREANFATVGDFWKDIVNFWKQHRFYYIKSGTAQIILKSASLNLTAGNLYYIPKNSVVTAINHEYLEHYFIHFETTDLGNTLLSSLLPVGGATPFIWVCAPGVVFDVGNIFEKIISVVNGNGSGISSELYLNGMMQIILSRFLRSNDVEEKFRNKNILRFFDIIQYIEDHIEEQITVRELANLANLNDVYFSNCFSKVIGIPPLQYIIDKKLQHAMLLMQDGRLSIKEIAYRLNFSDESYFSRLFKKKTGIPPSEFRAALQNESGSPQSG